MVVGPCSPSFPVDSLKSGGVSLLQEIFAKFVSLMLFVVVSAPDIERVDRFAARASLRTIHSVLFWGMLFCLFCYP